MLKLFEKTFWKLLDIFFPLPKVKDESTYKHDYEYDFGRDVSWPKEPKEFNKIESKLPEDDDPRILAEEIKQAIKKLDKLVNKLDPLSSSLEASFSSPPQNKQTLKPVCKLVDENDEVIFYFDVKNRIIRWKKFWGFPKKLSATDPEMGKIKRVANPAPAVISPSEVSF